VLSTGQDSAAPEVRFALVAESLLSTAFVVWVSYLLPPWRNVPYELPECAVVVAVTLSMLVTWGLWLRTRRFQRVNLALIAVRGVAVLTLLLWLLADL
jgi:hypothetical protein